jgi:hypothetical protein
MLIVIFITFISGYVCTSISAILMSVTRQYSIANFALTVAIVGSFMIIVIEFSSSFTKIIKLSS